jgi:hypothetical protein
MHHRGFTKLEMLVSASLLTTMIAIATPLFSQLNHVWYSTRLFQLASQELMNQMDGILQLSSDECRTALSELKVTPELRAVIPHAQLTGKIEPSSEGERIILFLQLPTSVRAEPIVLVGWLHGGVRQ